MSRGRRGFLNVASDVLERARPYELDSCEYRCLVGTGAVLQAS